METVVIVAPAPFDDELRRRLGDDWRVADRQVDLTVLDVTVSDGTSHVYMGRNDYVRDELEPEELARILDLFSNPVFYTVDFSFAHVALCRAVLLRVADDDDVLVDTTHGVVLRGSEFVRLLRERPEWDWR